MISAQSDSGPVSVSIPSSTVPRYLSFETSIEGLFVPHLSTIARMAGGSAAKNRNEGIRAILYGNKEKGLKPRPDITHFFFEDDDQQFDQDILLRLLAHKVPVVAALTCSRVPDFFPVVFKGEEPRGPGKRHGLGYSWSDLDPMKGLQPVFALPGAGALVAREVFTRIPEPWFEVGQMDSEEMGEDLYFWEKVRNIGVPLYIDLDTVQGHCFSGALWPTRGSDGRWTVKIVFENGKSLVLGRSDKL